MGTLSKSLDHKRFFMKFLAFFAFASATFTAAIILSYFFLRGTVDSKLYIFFALSNSSVNIFTTVVLITFLLLLYCFYVRFDLINSCLKKHFATHEDEVDETPKKRHSQVYINLVLKLADLHDSLVDATVQLNQCFAFQMMNLIAVIFCNNIFATFAIYRVFVRHDYNKFYQAIIQYGWNMYFLVYGMGIVTLGSLLTRTGKYTAVLCHKAINYIEDDEDPIIDYVSFKLFDIYRFFSSFLNSSVENVLSTNASSCADHHLRTLYLRFYSVVYGKFKNRLS